MRVASSNICTLDYDKKAKKLEVTFRSNPSRVYIYERVPLTKWVGLIKAQSKGSYFASHIKDQYKVQKLSLQTKKRLR